MSYKRREGAVRGRPVKKAEDKAVRQIHIRVTAEQERQIQELASKENLTISETIRAYVLAAALTASNPLEVGKAMLTDARLGREVVEPLPQAELERRGQQRVPGV